MVRILEKLGVDVRSRNVRKNLHLEFIRFRTFLDNMRNIIRLIEDTKDKLQEEYIFDRHYILSLVDDVLEESAMLAFNASVLSPAAVKEIYLQLDANKKFAQEEFLNPGNIRMEHFSVPASYRDADPETQWLSAALNWLAGPLPGDQPALMDFIRYVADETLENCRKEEMIQKAGKSARNVKLSEYRSLKLMAINEDLPLVIERSVSPGHIQCRPFGLLYVGLLDGAISEKIPEEESAFDSWMLFNEEEISLRLRGSRMKIHLEATLFGNVASDYIFLYFQNPFDAGSILPEEAWVEKTGRGTLAWIYDVPTDHLEKYLVQLGSDLFCRA